MAKVLLDMAVSLDGFVDGKGGADVGLYDWYAATSGPNHSVAEELVETTGATSSDGACSGGRTTRPDGTRRRTTFRTSW
ncbi:MAG TPA: hypothetical protein VNC23_09330 [Lapillicoccus sp.]|jgi:hypothetical protein|nr:hypothetical protein [Lapillicoccus sp.]